MYLTCGAQTRSVNDVGGGSFVCGTNGRQVTNRDREVVNCARSRVKNNSKLTNLMNISN